MVCGESSWHKRAVRVCVGRCVFVCVFACANLSVCLCSCRDPRNLYSEHLVLPSHRSLQDHIRCLSS